MDSLGQSKSESVDAESYWLTDWLLFEQLKITFDGKPWYEWPKEYRDRDPDALAEIEVDETAQARFMGRWKEIRAHAKSKQVSIVGDLPIFVGHDSADVWAHRELFLWMRKECHKLLQVFHQITSAKKATEMGDCSV